MGTLRTPKRKLKCECGLCTTCKARMASAARADAKLAYNKSKPRERTLCNCDLPECRICRRRHYLSTKKPKLSRAARTQVNREWRDRKKKKKKLTGLELVTPAGYTSSLDVNASYFVCFRSRGHGSDY